MKLIGYPGNARYVAVFYMGSKATWTDGRSSCTFSYYNAYQPLIDHPVMAIHLLDVHLGSDDEYPTHALICDRELRTFFIGDWQQVNLFVNQQEREEPDEDEIEEYRRAFEWPTTSAQMAGRGMFELFMKPDPSLEHDRLMLLQWLDNLITEELIKKICEMFKNDLRVWPQVEYIRRLVERYQESRAVNQ